MNTIIDNIMNSIMDSIILKYNFCCIGFIQIIYMSIFTPKVSFIKKVSLIFQRKAFIIYTDNPIPSLLIPLAETDKIINKGIYKIFCDLSNNDVISFNSKQLQ